MYFQVFKVLTGLRGLWVSASLLPWAISFSVALRLKDDSSVRRNPGPTPWQGRPNLGTLTAVASLGSDSVGYAYYTGHGLRSCPRAADKRQRRRLLRTLGNNSCSPFSNPR